MRWSIVRIIWLRELRDQLRDRRTLFMVAGLPLLLYPILGVAVLRFAAGFVDQPTKVGVVVGPSDKQFPALPSRHADPAVAACWPAVALPSLPGSGLPW